MGQMVCNFLNRIFETSGTQGMEYMCLLCGAAFIAVALLALAVRTPKLFMLAIIPAAVGVLVYCLKYTIEPTEESCCIIYSLLDYTPQRLTECTCSLWVVTAVFKLYERHGHVETDWFPLMWMALPTVFTVVDIMKCMATGTYGFYFATSIVLGMYSWFKCLFCPDNRPLIS